MMKTIQSRWPVYSEDEIDAVTSVLRSGKVNYWTGEECRRFEKEFARFCGAEYAVALSNGTVALELALRSLQIGDGDEVIVSSRTFLASASAIVVVGAIPVFSDVDPDSQNSTAETIAAVLTERTKAIIAVHLAGWPCDMDSIMELACANGLKVVEDCAQAHGAKYKGRSVGSIGDVGAWSFCQDKIMTTGGEGGMLTTNNPEVWEYAWSYKDHGKSWDSVYNTKHSSGFRWLHESWGTNWRMTEVQAAIGRIQIRKMAEWGQLRRCNAEAILSVGEEFSAFLRIPRPSVEIEHGYYKCYLFVRPDSLKGEWGRNKILSELVARRIPCFVGSCPEVYLEKVFKGTGFRPKERLPVAKKLGQTSLMFLVHPTLSKDEIDLTCNMIREVMQLVEKECILL